MTVPPHTLREKEWGEVSSALVKSPRSYCFLASACCDCLFAEIVITGTKVSQWFDQCDSTTAKFPARGTP